MADGKQAYLLGVLQQIHDAIDSTDTKTTLKHQMSTVAHSAPEIVDLRWRPLYDLCRYHINDETNPAHAVCFAIYHDGYSEYCKLFHGQ